MNRKPVVVLLVVLLVFALVLSGCKKSATGDVPDLPPVDQEAMAQEAGANTTPVPTVEVPVVTDPPVVTVEPTEEIIPTVTEEATSIPPIEATPVPVETVVVVTMTPETTSASGIHVVQPGENLFRIALRYGTTVEALSQLNSITNPALIRVGQQLRVSGSGGTPPTTPQPPVQPGTTYTVQPGDNLFRIALRYNMSHIYLAQYNGISSPYWVYAGQTLRIPAIP